MKSVAIKGVREFEIKEIEEPKVLEDKVLIEVSRCGICGSDIHYWENGEPVGLVMGHEYSGVVVDPGNRSDLSIGDRVTGLPISPCGECEACENGNVQYCPATWSLATGLSLENPGGFTSKISVRSDMVIKVPDNINDEEVAMVEPAAVGLHAIHLANIEVGSRVLVIGAGIIGLMCALFAKKEGASYVAVSETNEKRGEKAVSLGVADEWFNAKDEDVLSKFNEVSRGGFDYVIDCSGNSPAVSTALMAAKPGGTVILVGVATAPITIPTMVAVIKELTVIGAIAYTKKEFQTCIDLISSGQLEVMKFVSKIIGLDEVQSAFEELTSGESESIKILINPSK